MSQCLQARLTMTYDGEPLAVIDGLPGAGAELRPHELRELAAALLKVAADAEERKLTHRGRPLPTMRRDYPLRPPTPPVARAAR